jgi:hypothetical protein
MNVHTYKKQVGGKGYYAEMTFAVKSTSLSHNIEIIYQADTQWEDACRAGVRLFYDYFSRKNLGGLEVIIQEIRWNPVDTNNLIVLFTTVKALKEALNIEIDGLQFDAIAETFHFPERRKFCKQFL